jgi:hypothetical protein
MIARKPLCPQFNHVVRGMATRLWPQGFDLASDLDIDWPRLQAMHARALRLTGIGRIAVWTGGSDLTIFGSADQDANWAFRAWHDWCHLFGQFDFSLAGEAAACRMQQAQVLATYGYDANTCACCMLLDIEINQQAQHYAATGEFIEDQWQFAKDRL